MIYFQKLLELNSIMSVRTRSNSFCFFPEWLILMLREMPEKNTDLSLPICALGIPNVFTIEEAAGEGDNLVSHLSRECISYLFLVDSLMLNH